jgi:biopolymer transport protein ExbB/biopolymer transport protein TolQ
MGVDLMHLWSTMGWFAKGIVWILFFMSFISIAVAIRRWWDLMKSRRQTIKFAPELSSALESNDLGAAGQAVESYPKGHLACAYKGVFSALGQHVSDRSLTAVEVGAILRTIDLNKLEQLARFRRGLGILATVGATAPFVGLLGTTMGVVNAFTGMAAAGSGGLTAISAGIAEALIATAIGLAVAIPAVWLYNYFTNRIELVSMEIDYGSKEFMNFLLAIESRMAKGLDPFASAAAPKRAQPATAGRA